jgi:hypothetical protein
MSTDSGSNYNVTKTTTAFRSWHNEADTDTAAQYESTYDLAQSTGFQHIITKFIWCRRKYGWIFNNI